VVRTLTRREFLVARAYRGAFIFDLFFGFISLGIYFYISRTFRHGSAHNLAGAPTYFAFAAVGVSLSMVVQAASARLAQRMREEQLTGGLETLVAQPITAGELSVGLAGYPFSFAVLRAFAYLVVAGLFFGLNFSHTSWPGLVVLLFIFGIAMACIGVGLAAVILVLRQAQILITLTTLGLFLVGGAYFPVSVLPSWLRPLADVLPTRFAFDGIRAAVFRGGGWVADAAWLTLFCAVAIPMAAFSFTGALSLAKRRGSLASY
jgi:ABC-2 type transport system permease protein